MADACARSAIVPALVASLLVTACSGWNDGPANLTVDGVKIYLDVPDARAPWLSRPDTPARLHAVFEASLAFWGATTIPADSKIIILPSDGSVFPCGQPTWNACFHTETREDFGVRRTRWVIEARDDVGGWSADGSPAPCVELFELPHEIGHGVIGDFGHVDPRWREVYGAVNSPLIRAHADCFHAVN